MYKKSWLTYLCDVVCWISTNRYIDWSELIHVLKAVVIVTIEHLTLSTIFEVTIDLLLIAKVTPQRKLNPGFGTQKSVPFPWIEVSFRFLRGNKYKDYVSISLAGTKPCPLNGGVPWIEVSQRRGSTVVIELAGPKWSYMWKEKGEVLSLERNLASEVTLDQIVIL